MMEAKDTVMSDTALEENIQKDYNDFTIKSQADDIQDILIWTREAQAEITWDKAIREVVEWIKTERKCRYIDNVLYYPVYENALEVKEKEWGINDGS